MDDAENLSPSPLHMDSHGDATHTVIASVACPLLRVAGSAGLNVSILEFYPANFPLAAPLSLALQGVLQDGFRNGVVSSNVARSENRSHQLIKTSLDVC